MFSKSRTNKLKLKRNEDLPVLKMNITQDTMCKELPEYIYKWRVLTAEIVENLYYGNILSTFF